MTVCAVFTVKSGNANVDTLSFFTGIHVSKRLLGLHLIIIGVTGNAVMIGWDLVRRSEHGVGPQQKAAMIVLAIGAVIGLTLLPLGRTKA